MSHPADRLTARGLRYGGDWNPEQWPDSTLAEDLALMLDAHVNLVTVGVFSWGRLQPSPDTWDWAWLDRVVEQTTAAGIEVDLATPTASPPPWLGIAHPETLSVARDGVRVGHGSRNHFCPSSAVYRERCRDIAGRLGERYGSTPGVVMWHIGNEYGQECFCDLCAGRFRAWLVARSSSLDALNDAWGTTFWSQHYSAWDEIMPPRRAPYLINPGQALDWRRFCSDNLRSLYEEQVAGLRPLVGDAPITTNYMGFFPLIDYQSWAPDIVADDHYVDPADPSSPARAALTHDLMRSLGHGRWMMMEQSMGAVNWREHNVPKTSAQRRADVLRAVAHGADGVLSFQWRQARFGSERYHGALLTNAGPEAPLHRDVREIGAVLERVSGVAGVVEPARVAVLFDWISRWTADEPSVPSRRFSLLTELERWYRPLWERGVAVDVVPPTADLGRYALVLAPCQHALDAAGLAALRTRVESGRELVLGPFSAAVDEHDRLLPGPFPGGLFDLLGARGEQWWPLPDAGVRVISSLLGDAQVQLWAEQLTVTGAEVLARFDHADLDAAVVRRGSFTYVGARLAEAQLQALVDDVLARAGVQPDLGVLAEMPAGYEVSVRGDVTFVLPLCGTGGTLRLTGPVHDLVSDRDLIGDVPLQPGASYALVRR